MVGDRASEQVMAEYRGTFLACWECVIHSQVLQPDVEGIDDMVESVNAYFIRSSVILPASTRSLTKSRQMAFSSEWVEWLSGDF